MESRKEKLTEIFSYTTIAVSMALLSGMALGYATEISIDPRLSANPHADPVERFGLGQNAYETPNRNAEPFYGEGAEYANANYEIGKYVNGARVLMPSEPARKIDRLNLEELQAWNEQSFGTSADLDDERYRYNATNDKDHEPIDVGAVKNASETAVGQASSHVRIADNRTKQKTIIRDIQKISARSAPEPPSVLTGS